MPGIVGLFSNRDIDGLVFDRMLEQCRGGNHSVDRHVSPGFAIGRTHLGVFNNGPQPVFSEDGGLCIAIDGIIHGCPHKGYSYTSGQPVQEGQCQAHYCLEAYQAEGPEFVLRLNGNFVIVIHDKRKGVTHILNDRHALRTHFYAIAAGRLLIAPRASAIVESGFVDKKLDETSVACFLAFGTFIGEKTLFEGVRAIRPASILTFDGGKLRHTKYWRWQYSPNYGKSEADHVEELHDSLVQAVETRLARNLSYCLSLSGGLDSRTVLSAIKEVDGLGRISAHTVGPPKCAEVEIARRVASKAGLTHHVFANSPELTAAHAAESVSLTDGRDYAGVSYILPFHKSMRNSGEVLLDGLMLDLTLGGSYLGKSGTQSEDNMRSKLLARANKVFSLAELPDLLTTQFNKRVDGLPSDMFAAEFDGLPHGLPENRCDSFFLNTLGAYLPIAYQLVRQNLETVFPTMDNFFLSTVLSIPPELRRRHQIHRRLLRRLSPKLSWLPYEKTMLPPALPVWLWGWGIRFRHATHSAKKALRRASHGSIDIRNNRSYVDYGFWLRNAPEWRSLVQRETTDAHSPISRYVNVDYSTKLFHDHLSGIADHSLKLLHLTTLGLFLREHFP